MNDELIIYASQQLRSTLIYQYDRRTTNTILIDIGFKIIETIRLIILTVK